MAKILKFESKEQKAAELIKSLDPEFVKDILKYLEITKKEVARKKREHLVLL